MSMQKIETISGLNDSKIIELLNKIEEIAEQYKRESEKSPYHINIIDELHANENAHTRILIKLLKFSKSGCFPFLDLFVKLLSQWDDGIIISNPLIQDNIEYIDGLVMEDRKYAIIIENKIHWAVDQDRQLERYVDKVISRGVPKDKIWVVYLTRDGSKIPSDYSFTEKVKNIIGERYTPIDYRNHILPWLKEQVLSSCKEDEEYLICAIKQYIDHLDGMFQQRESDKEINKNMEKNIMEILGISDQADISKVYDRLAIEEEKVWSVHQMLVNFRQNIVGDVRGAFTEITELYFKEKYPNRDFKINDKLDYGFYQIWPSDWDEYVHLEWHPLYLKDLLQNSTLSIVLHVEDQNRPIIANLIKKIDEDAEYKQQFPDRKKFSDPDAFFMKEIELGQPFVKMSHEEQKDALYEAYDKMQWIIGVIDRCFNYK